MVGSEWTSPEQKEYLESLLEEYAKIAPTKRYGRFWTQVNETWLRRWPVVQPEPIGEVVFNPSDPNPPQLSLQQRTDKAFALAIDLVLQKIKTWFRWRYSQSASTRATAPKQTSAAVKVTRAKTAVETFQILFYQTRVKPIVTLELSRLKEEGKDVNSKVRLTVQKRITQELFDAADAATLSTIKARQLSDKTDADAIAALSIPSKDNVMPPTPEEYQLAITGLPHMIDTFFAEMAFRTGWAFTCVMGGPMPSSGGRIVVASNHIGLTVARNNFGAAYRPFETEWMGAYGQFVRDVFPRSVRSARALTGPAAIASTQSAVDIFSASSSSSTTLPGSPLFTNPPATPTQGGAMTCPPTPLLWGDPLVFSPPPQTWTSTNDDPFDIPLPRSPDSQFTFTLPSHNPPSPLALKLTQIAADAAEAEAELELESALRLSAMATERHAEAITSHSIEDSERLADQEEDCAEEQLQIQDEMNRAEKEMAKLRKVVPVFPSTRAKPAPPPPKFPAPNALPSFHSPSPTSPRNLAKRPRPKPWVPPLSTPLSPLPLTLTSPSRSHPITSTATTIPSTASPPPSQVPFSLLKDYEDAPEWVHAAATYLNEPALGSNWAECIEGWLKLGKLSHYNDKGTLGTTSRPPEVSWWISRARKYDRPPTIEHKNVKLYAQKWSAWWSGIQPEWRRGTGPLPPAIYQCEEDDWGALRCSGRNGILIVLCAMIWWGRAMGVNLTAEWTSAVQDVSRVLASMTNKGQKRPSSSDTVSLAKRRKYIK